MIVKNVVRVSLSEENKESLSLTEMSFHCYGVHFTSKLTENLHKDTVFFNTKIKIKR